MRLSHRGGCFWVAIYLDVDMDLPQLCGGMQGVAVVTSESGKRAVWRTTVNTHDLITIATPFAASQEYFVFNTYSQRLGPFTQASLACPAFISLRRYIRIRSTSAVRCPLAL